MQNTEKNAKKIKKCKKVCTNQSLYGIINIYKVKK